MRFVGRLVLISVLACDCLQGPLTKRARSTGNTFKIFWMGHACIAPQFLFLYTLCTSVKSDAVFYIMAVNFAALQLFIASNFI